MTEPLRPVGVAPVDVGAGDAEPGAGVSTTAKDATAAAGILAASISPKKMALKRFLNHRAAVISTVVLAIVVLWVVLSPITARYGVNQAIFKSESGNLNSNLAPRAAAWMGTDSNGRDIYSRMIFGARVSLLVGLFTALGSVLLGTAVGAIAGYKGGRIDDLLMRATDIFLALPLLVILVIVRGALGNIGWITVIMGEKSSVRFLVILLSLIGWMGVARLVRGQVKQLREREFIEASRALGASTTRIMVRHLLPNSIGTIMVALTFSVVAAITAEATLSFFGFGPDPGAGMTSLGLLIRDSKKAVPPGYWWLVVYPGALFIVISLCINFIGDGLRDALDP
ncbi:MAG TPA: ABC transporter permease, partial [Ilumatobacteraceae bacterium]|nr:ABC transporter permease [Ilumatobacteraceae bacterium]